MYMCYFIKCVIKLLQQKFRRSKRAQKTNFAHIKGTNLKLSCMYTKLKKNLYTISLAKETVTDSKYFIRWNKSVFFTAFTLVLYIKIM